MTLQIKRATRSKIDVAALRGELLLGEPLLITDESRFAIATSTKTYESFAKLSEAAGASFNGNLNYNLNFLGAGKRITGDFSNATVANRVMFQSSSVNTNTTVLAIPNGVGNETAFVAINNSNPTNSGYCAIDANTSEARLISGIYGTGTYLPQHFYVGGISRVKINTDGSVIIGDPTIPVGSSKLNTDGNITIRDVSPTLYLRDTDGMSAMVHCNSNTLYFLRGGVDTESWTQINSQWPLMLDLNSNNAIFGGMIMAAYQPGFHVRHTNNSLTTGVIVWTDVVYDRASNYNTTNGRFTAPVSGTYQFAANTLTSYDSGGDTRMAFYKNGTLYGGTIFITNKVANTWQTISANATIYLSAGDYIQVVMVQNPGTLAWDIYYNSFSGHLVA